MDYSLPEEHFQQKIEMIIEEALQDKRVRLDIKDFRMREGPGPLSIVECVLLADSRVTFVTARGEGIVDALFTALAHHFRDTCLCLDTVALDDFTLKTHFKDSSSARRADAPVEIMLVLKTNLGTRLYFRAKSRSLVSAVIEVVRKSIEFLINCEKTVTELYLHIEDLRRDARRTAEEMRVLKLADVVRVANFEETIKRVKWLTQKQPLP
tara:strand:- start:562 stop:1191 length:630 start_codon:yes stop_codon:yes gene_type:complete